jgi:hypothetical protein
MDLDSAAGKSIFGVKPKLFSIGSDVSGRWILTAFQGYGLVSRFGWFSQDWFWFFSWFGLFSQDWFSVFIS